MFSQNIRSNIKNWLPPAVITASRRARTEAAFLKAPHKDILLKNKSLHGAATQSRGFILATGPSLKKEDLKTLAGQDCFSVSNFFLHPDLQSVRPKIHAFAPYHEPLIESNYLDWLKKSDDVLPPETRIVLGLSEFERVQKAQIFKNREVFYLYLDLFPSRSKLDLTRPILKPLTGPMMLVPVLIAMGYQEIGLLGCDHTALRNYNQTIEHFYEKGQDPRKNASDAASWTQKDIREELFYTREMFQQYHFYLTNFCKGKIRLVNLSQDSWLDFIPSAKLSEWVASK